MGTKGKAILAIICLAALFIILAKPMLKTDSRQAATSPYQLYNTALQQGKPMFVDFYSPR